MCGIAGIVTRDAYGSLINDVDRMISAVNHRGPDDAGSLLINDNIVFGHARLAIQDLSPNGQQPMKSRSGRYVIAFNGEIYNFIGIRDQLKALGHDFVGGSDTEVILASIEEWGLEQSLEKFEGMFAFSLQDTQEDHLYLCRDRLGEKPLFYGWIDGYFVWASELKSLTTLPFWKSSISHNSISSYLQYGYVPMPYSIYEDIYKLVPGSLLKIDTNTISKDNFSPYCNDDNSTLHPYYYWKFSETITNGQKISEQQNKSYDQSVDELDVLLTRVTRDQMISDVPYGAFLSGGIDSSLVTSIMQSISEKPVNTFTIGFTETDFNEAIYAKEISDHLGTNHNELYISIQDCLNIVPNIPGMMDEPFADSSVIPSYFVSAMAREHVTVCLSGDGGDELFCGYNRYTMTDKIWNKVKNIPVGFRLLAANILGLFPASMIDSVYRMLTIFLSSKHKNTRVGLKLQKLAALLKMKNINEIYDMLVSYCKTTDNVLNIESNRLPLLSDGFSSILSQESNYMEHAMAIDTVTYLPDDNLTKVDRTSMASSLETRLPLLNHKVLEFAWTLPIEFRTDNGVSKKILRDVLFKRVPRKLIERPKMGFSVPIADWLRGPLKEWAEELLTNDDSLSHGYFNKNSIRKLWLDHVERKKDNSAPLWCILMFQSWYANTIKPQTTQK